MHLDLSINLSQNLYINIIMSTIFTTSIDDDEEFFTEEDGDVFKRFQRALSCHLEGSSHVFVILGASVSHFVK